MNRVQVERVLRQNVKNLYYCPANRSGSSTAAGPRTGTGQPPGDSLRFSAKGHQPGSECCGCSSVGRAQRCQRCCRGFESHHPLSLGDALFSFPLRR